VGQALVQLCDEAADGGQSVRTLVGQYMAEYGHVYQPAFLGGWTTAVRRPPACLFPVACAPNAPCAAPHRASPRLPLPPARPAAQARWTRTCERTSRRSAASCSAPRCTSTSPPWRRRSPRRSCRRRSGSSPLAATSRRPRRPPGCSLRRRRRQRRRRGGSSSSRAARRPGRGAGRPGGRRRRRRSSSWGPRRRERPGASRR
jgi:hypothetical protein